MALLFVPEHMRFSSGRLGLISCRASREDEQGMSFDRGRRGERGGRGRDKRDSFGDDNFYGGGGFEDR
ncbi:MAG TPA: hypothetical protein VM662_03625, partial [Sphingomonas sp.]|nr:hypothetical protein [Sphingomonas sp.]